MSAVNDLFKAVHHIGYRVEDMDRAIAEYQRVLDAPVLRRSTNPRGIPIAFVQVGANQVELVGNGQGPDQVMDHVAYAVDDLDAAMAALKAKGAQFESETPVPGSAPGSKYVFVRLMGARLQVFQP